jgi:hypothetical protein
MSFHTGGEIQQQQKSRRKKVEVISWNIEKQWLKVLSSEMDPAKIRLIR